MKRPISRSTIRFVLLALTVAAAPALGGDEPVEPTGRDSAEQLVRGALLYRIHCQNCHGEAGAGDGPMAKLLTIDPKDLTRIDPTDTGEFPVDEVRQAIDGRTEVRAHGTREMPVWGLTLQQPGRDSAQEDEIQARIDDLMAHLKSIQVEESGS